MTRFLLWCLLLVFCWPLALLALVLYPFVWLLLLPFRLVGIAVVDDVGGDFHRRQHGCVICRYGAHRFGNGAVKMRDIHGRMNLHLLAGATSEGRALAKQKAPARPGGQAGTKWGMGVRHALFPALTFGAKLAASFPTPFSTASGVLGLIAGPS